MSATGLALIVAALLPAGQDAAWRPAGAVEPTSNLRVAVNGMQVLCPTLVHGGTVPDAAALAAMGFVATPAPVKGDARFEGRHDLDAVRVDHEGAAHRCTVNYGGGGFHAVAGVARALVTNNGFTRLTGGSDKGATTDVFRGPTPGGTATGRFIIVENVATRTAAISYTEEKGA